MARYAITRRRVLGGGAMLALGWVSALLVGHRPVPGAPSRCLGDGPLRTLELAFAAILPTAEDARIAASGVDAFLADGDPVAADQLRVALLVLEHAGGLGPTQLRRFSRLDPAERIEVLRSWQLSRIGVKRQIFQAVRKAAVFAHYSRPQTWPEIGYDGPWVSG